jgi:uncharacterized protein
MQISMQRTGYASLPLHGGKAPAWLTGRMQALAKEISSARHWLSDTTKSFMEEPHNAIVGDTKHATVLDMTAKASEANRKASVDLAKEPISKLKRLTKNAIMPADPKQQSLQSWIPNSQTIQPQPTWLNMPWNINWDALSQAYQTQPNNYEQLLAIKGVGPSTVRGLALIAEIVYGEAPSWKDPVKYSFAYGGKDGVPYPVNRQAMDESISILRNAVEATKVGDKEKTRALQGLQR